MKANLTTKETAKQAGKPQKVVVQAFDSLQALLKMECQSCEAIGIRRDEPERDLAQAWEQAAEQNYSNILGIPPTRFRTPGPFASLAQVTGTAKHGKRVAFFSSRSDLCLDPSAIRSAPFVLHHLSPSPKIAAFAPFFQLIARSPQQAADLCLIARRTAELSLVPGILHSEQDFDCIAYEFAQTVDIATIREYLGSPADKIVPPTTAQRQHFGALRRRIPDLSENHSLNLLSQSLLTDVPALCHSAMQAFKKLTGRSYHPIEEVNTADADIIIVATGRQFHFLQENLAKIQKSTDSKIGLLHPTLIFPFPGQLAGNILKGKRACIILTSYPDPLTDPVLREIQLSFERASANGLAEIRGNATQPFPGYSAIKKVIERPQLYACYSSENTFDLEKLSHALVRINEGRENSTALDISPSKNLPSKNQTQPASKSTLHLTINLPESDKVGVKIAEYFQNILPFQISMQRIPSANRFHIQLARKKVGFSHIESKADVLISNAVQLNDSSVNFETLKDNGVWLLLAKQNEISAFWQSLTDEQQTIIRQKKRMNFMFDGTFGSGKDRLYCYGELCGALLKIFQLADFRIFTNDMVTAARDFLTSNGSIRFAEAAQRGFENVKEFDFTQLEAAPEETLFEPQQAAIHEQKMPEAAENAISQKPQDFLKALLKFCVTAEKPMQTGDLAHLRLMPALLHGYKDITRIRYTYPVCLLEDDSEKVVISLMEIFDNLIENLAHESDDAERLKRHLLQLEAEIKNANLSAENQQLLQLWDRAAATLVEKSASDAKQQKVRRSDYATAKQALKVNGPVIGCDQHTPARLLHTAWKAVWKQKSQQFAKELDTLTASLAEIFQVDFTKSSEAQNPEYLKASIGQTYSDDLDFDRLSHLLAEKPDNRQKQHEKRLTRIEEAWLMIKEFRELFSTRNSTVKKSTDTFWPELAETVSIADALGHALAHFREILEFFRAAHIAKLEVRNKYSEDKHDRYFAEFDFSKLTAEEAALLPPYIVRIKAKNLDEIDRSSLVELLASELPIKILLTIEELCEGEILATDAIAFSCWVTKIAEIARSTNKSFVLQTASSNLPHLVAGLKDGLLYDGPALFCVYTGSDSNSSQLSPYLQSAAALESRILPAFTFNPAAGDTSAENFTIAPTPQFDKDWPVNALTYQDAEGQETTQDLTFTLADFLATDPRFARHFLSVSRENWREQMIPVTEFLENFQANLGQKIPFLLMVADDGTLYRVVVSYAIAAATARCLRDWRNLQELGGVNNSHAQRLLQQEKAHLEDEKQQEIQEVEAKHQEALDKAVGEVAQEIVSNIAAGLLDQGTVATPPVAIPAPAPITNDPALQPVAEAPTKESVESVKDEEDETETLSLDEPYIETVRCTTCNECTMINPQMFAYNAEKQAYIKDINAGTYRNLVESAEKCPVRIIHPGKPVNPDEPGLEDLLKRAEPFL